MQISYYCLFNSLEIDCLTLNEHGNICIAGLIRQVGYATDWEQTIPLFYVLKNVIGTQNMLMYFRSNRLYI